MMMLHALIRDDQPIRRSEPTFVTDLDSPVCGTLSKIQKLDLDGRSRHRFIRNHEFSYPPFQHLISDTINIFNVINLPMGAVQEQISTDIIEGSSIFYCVRTSFLLYSTIVGLFLLLSLPDTFSAMYIY